MVEEVILRSLVAILRKLCYSREIRTKWTGNAASLDFWVKVGFIPDTRCLIVNQTALL